MYIVYFLLRKLSMVYRLRVEAFFKHFVTLSLLELLLRHSFLQQQQNVVISLLLQSPGNLVSDKPLTIRYYFYFTEIIISIWKEQNAVNMI